MQKFRCLLFVLKQSYKNIFQRGGATKKFQLRGATHWMGRVLSKNFKGRGGVSGPKGVNVFTGRR